MTPPAATAAARLGSTAMPVRERRPAAPSRRRSDSPSTRIPRRVSGPQTGRRAVAEPRVAVEPSAATSIAEQSALGILSRGRVWVALFAVGLAGLVFLQGELRGLNSDTGSSVQAITKLERQNAVLRADLSSLTSDQRIYSEAARMGFVEPPVGSSKYLTAQSGNAAKALATMTAAAAPTTALADSGAANGTDGASGTDSSGLPSGADVTVGGQSTDGEAVATTAAVPDSGTGSTSDTSGG